MQKYNALVVGAGNIGALYDISEMSGENTLTHAHMYKNSDNFNLAGFVDIDYEKAEKAAIIWETNAYKTIEEAFENKKFDVVSVATPDKVHFQTLKELSKYDLKLVIAEKPLTKTINEVDEIINIYKNKNIPILVNYSRRFPRVFNDLKDRLKQKEFGDFICGCGYYGKGILHNGSHMIDLLRFLIGEINDFHYINHIKDFYDDDPSVSVNLKFKDNGYFILNAVDCRNFTIFEADFIFEKARIRMIDSGNRIEIYKIQENEIYKEYRNLVKEEEEDTSLKFAMKRLEENAYKHLMSGEKLFCIVDDAYKAMELPLKIIETIPR